MNSSRINQHLGDDERQVIQQIRPSSAMKGNSAIRNNPNLSNINQIGSSFRLDESTIESNNWS